MPRDGSGVYTKPYPSVVSGTTIESLVYNGQVDDVTADLNTPRPIVAGGTGASSADAALVNLGGEKAKQVVTNYDSHAFVAGSFYSAPGAIGAPEATFGYSGICHVYDTGNFMTLEARDYGTGAAWLRQKNSGTWSAWSSQPSSVGDLDGRYVNITGDTMTGSLVVTGSVGATVGYLTKSGESAPITGSVFNTSWGGAGSADTNGLHLWIADTDLGATWTDAAMSKSYSIAGGYHSFRAGGLLLQWGSAVSIFDGGSNAVITFPTAFPTKVLRAMAINGDSTAQPGFIFSLYTASGGYPTPTTLIVHAVSDAGANVPGATARVDWLAIGH